MLPFLIHKGTFYLPTFYFMIMVASLVTTFYVYWQAGRKGFDRIAILDMAMVGTVGGVIGARLFHVFVEAPGYYWEHPTYVFHVWQGGFVGYGAFIGTTISVLLYLKYKKLPVLDYADLTALGCPLIIFFIRIGCLGAGCCYGKPTDFFLHLVFTNPASDAGHKLPGQWLHATQIYDMINAAIGFGLVHWVYPRRKFSGQVMLVFFMSYAIGRFFIEFLRGDADRGVYFNNLISTSQITGLVIVAVCLVFWKILSKRYPRVPA